MTDLLKAIGAIQEPFDYTTEHPVDNINGVVVDYEGRVEFEYPVYSDFGISSDTLNFAIEELEAILEVAKAQRAKYQAHLESL